MRFFRLGVSTSQNCNGDGEVILKKIGRRMCVQENLLILKSQRGASTDKSSCEILLSVMTSFDFAYLDNEYQSSRLYLLVSLEDLFVHLAFEDFHRS